MTENKSDITGRDMYVVLQALAYAIETIKPLPSECQYQRRGGYEGSLECHVRPGASGQISY
jgi:hypothetical protein